MSFMNEVDSVLGPGERPAGGPRGYAARLMELEKQHEDTLATITKIRSRASLDSRALTESELTQIGASSAMASRLEAAIEKHKANNTLPSLVAEHGPGILMGGVPDGSRWNDDSAVNVASASFADHMPREQRAAMMAPKVAAFKSKFASWVNHALTQLGGLAPAMEATAPSGPISIGDTEGWNSIGITVPTEVLPYLPSYYNLDSFTLAGATQLITGHTRPLVKPILSAGAAASTFAENAAPSTSQPFGLSSFTFNGTKYSRLVLTSYESLMNSELPLQGAILDELLSTLATTFTSAITTLFVSALTAPPGISGASPLGVAINGSGGSVYNSMIALRHAIPPRFDSPENKWMVSRATLSQIRETKASTSGVPLFNPDGGLIFDRPYVINDNLDTASGAGVGFVAFGDFANGCWLRKTPIQTRIFLELYAQSGEVGFRVTQWLDAHFLAELAGASQPPTFQPLYYTNVASES